MKIVATTSLPAVDRPNADRWNAARSRQYQCDTPPHPGKYIWATSRLPRKLKFGMEALFNQTR